MHLVAAAPAPIVVKGLLGNRPGGLACGVSDVLVLVEEGVYLGLEGRSEGCGGGRRGSGGDRCLCRLYSCLPAATLGFRV